MKITLELHEENEMAQIKISGYIVHVGNYWDFHAGCHGTNITLKNGKTIDFSEEWTENIRRPWSVAQMIADKLSDGTYKTIQRKTPIL